MTSRDLFLAVRNGSFAHGTICAFVVSSKLLSGFRKIGHVIDDVATEEFPKCTAQNRDVAVCNFLKQLDIRFEGRDSFTVGTSSSSASRSIASGAGSTRKSVSALDSEDWLFVDGDAAVFPSRSSR